MTRLGWSERPIAALANYENGYPFKPHQLGDTGTPIVRIRQLNDPSAGFDHYEGDLEPKYQLSDGDLIFSWSGSLSVGFWTRGNAFLNQHLFRVDPASGVDKRWLAYALTWSVAHFEGFMHGSAMTHITKPMMKAVRAPVPPVDEQRAIADYLDRETARIDTLIEEQQRLIEMLRERRGAAVEDAVSTVAISGPRFKHLIHKVRQGWSPQCHAWPADGVQTWAVLKAGAANGGAFRPMENKELPAEEPPRPEVVVRQGDLVVSRANTRELVGSAAVVESEFPRLMLCDKLYAFELDDDRADPRYVATVLGSRRWRDLIQIEATGASHSMLNISQSDIVNLPMPVPPLDEQHRVVSRLGAQTSKIDKLIAETERFIELSRERRAALITAAVTGQIDVREVA